MKKFFTPSTVLATLALVLAMGGGAVASQLSSSLTTTNLTPLNGWKGAPFSTAAPAAGSSNGIVYLKGAVFHATGPANFHVFTLPVAFRPKHAVFVAADMCNGSAGRLDIATDGTVTIQVDGTTATQADAECFTALDGVEYVQ